jgi:hypothetical protein
MNAKRSQLEQPAIEKLWVEDRAFSFDPALTCALEKKIIVYNEKFINISSEQKQNSHRVW